MKAIKKTVADFEQAHGGSKIKELNAKLAQEHAKVEALAGTKDKVHVIDRTDDNVIRFGLIGDTQYGSLYSCPENQIAFYEACDREGIDTVLHAGDVLDGWKVYKGQEFELADVGWDAQLARLKAVKLPSGITTKFITGNHDLSFKSLIGINVGESIASARPGFEYLGEEQGRVEFRNKNGDAYSVMLVHPGGGVAYAVSYKMQKFIEAMEGGRKPNMLGIGHYHKADLLPSYRNVCGIQVGAFQWQTPFMARQGSPAHVGGWIVEVTPGKTYNRVRAEFIAFYR